MSFFLRVGIRDHLGEGSFLAGVLQGGSFLGFYLHSKKKVVILGWRTSGSFGLGSFGGLTVLLQVRVGREGGSFCFLEVSSCYLVSG